MPGTLVTGGITTGVVGRPWRATVTPWGSISPWDADRDLDWYVAADDRWHVPREETTVRQHRVEGTAVVETRVRVPGGDVVQRVYSVADAGGMTVVEFANESPVPVAIALSHRQVRTERPIPDRPVEGIELPADAFSLPLAHRATIRVALAHTGSPTGAVPPNLTSPTGIVRGWHTTLARASRLVLPSWTEEVAAARCEVALAGPVAVADDPAAFAIGLGEFVRLGEPTDPWLGELVAAIEAIGPRPGWEGDVALAAARRVLVAADERRAIGDLDRILGRRAAAPRPSEAPAGIALVPWVETLIATGGGLLPDGIPTGWLGQSFEVYGVPTVGASSVSLAVRWHGERPAVLWEQAGDPIRLSSPVAAPGWSTDEASGEALWPVPPNADEARSPR